VLALSNAYSQNRDRRLALGPSGEDQHAFFVDAVGRPDIPVFFKRLTPAQKLTVARNLERYDDPAIVRLAVIWLADFDADARAELTRVVSRLAASQADAVVGELKNPGGFQKLAVFQALDTQGASVLPRVVAALDKPELRANAGEYIANRGQGAGELLLAHFPGADKDTKLAVADALGKIGYKPAGPVLLAAYRGASGPDKAAYLAAIANLGWTPAEGLLSGIADDPAASHADRSTATLGLGRIATTSAVAALAAHAVHDVSLRADAIGALQLAGDRSLASPLLPPDVRLEVAAGIRSGTADGVIRSSLSGPLALEAAKAALGRPGLVPDLASRLVGLDAGTQGRLVAGLVDALRSTPAGVRRLDGLRGRPYLAGFILRAEARGR